MWLNNRKKNISFVYLLINNHICLIFLYQFYVLFLIGSQKFLSGDKSSKNGAMEIRNPKIFNMLPAYEKAQYPYILISDSGLMMHENTLYDMAMCMTDNVGLVHQMPFTCDRKGFAASVEKVGIKETISN
jgi:hypothetical protein